MVDSVDCFCVLVHCFSLEKEYAQPWLKLYRRASNTVTMTKQAQSMKNLFFLQDTTIPI